MPVYKSNANEPKTIYVDMTFRPGEEKTVKRYVNLDEYPFLTKVSDEPFQEDKLIFDAVNAVGISPLQDFYRSITLRVTDEAPGSGAGNTVSISILAGDTDDINKFIILKDIVFTKKEIASGVNLWGFDTNVIENVQFNAFKFYYIAITAITVNAPIKIYAKTVM